MMETFLNNGYISVNCLFLNVVKLWKSGWVLIGIQMIFSSTSSMKYKVLKITLSMHAIAESCWVANTLFNSLR